MNLSASRYTYRRFAIILPTETLGFKAVVEILGF
jgi:hypothetical protein